MERRIEPRERKRRSIKQPGALSILAHGEGEPEQSRECNPMLAIQDAPGADANQREENYRPEESSRGLGENHRGKTGVEPPPHRTRAFRRGLRGKRHPSRTHPDYSLEENRFCKQLMLVPE